MRGLAGYDITGIASRSPGYRFVLPGMTSRVSIIVPRLSLLVHTGIDYSSTVIASRSHGYRL
jgi:hypothetical protein